MYVSVNHIHSAIVLKHSENVRLYSIYAERNHKPNV